MNIHDVTIPTSSIKFHRTVAMDGAAPCSPVRLVQYDSTIPIAAIKLTENSVPYTPPSTAAIRVRMHKPDGHGVYNAALGFENGAVYFAFTQQMTAACGAGYINIEVSLPNGAVKCSDAIPVEIARNAVQEGQIESTDEWQTIDQILEEVKKLAKQAADSAKAAKQSESNAKKSELAAADSATQSNNSSTLSQSWAVGGTGTRPDEDTNNSKYFAGQSNTSAQSATSSKNAAANSASQAVTSAASASKDAKRAEDAADRATSIVQGQKGFFPTPEALRKAHPTGQNGDWAIVGSTDSIWTWDFDTNSWKDSHDKSDLANYYNKQQSDTRYRKNYIKNIISNDDWNNFNESGYYACDNSGIDSQKNSPFEAFPELYKYGVLNNVIITSRFKFQVYSPHSKGSSVYRVYVDRWSAWQKTGTGLTAQDVGALGKNDRAADSAKLENNTLAQIKAQFTESITPAGITIPFAGKIAPAGWLACDGKAVSRTIYKKLFDVIGTLYGSGDGRTTFNLPNMTGYTVIGGTGAQVGTKIGESAHLLTVGEMPNHSHPTGEGDGYWRYGGVNTNLSRPDSDTVRQWGQRVNSAAAQGNNQSHNNMQPSVYMTYIIKT